MNPKFTDLRRRFHQGLLNTVLTKNGKGVPSIADGSNRTSVEISKALLNQLGDSREAVKVPGQTAGDCFETACAGFLKDSFSLLSHLRPGRWKVFKVSGRRRNAIAEFEQYEHLAELENAIAANRELATSLGNDYSIAPDIVVTRDAEPDDYINHPQLIVGDDIAKRSPLRQTCNELPLIHASVSCKWTLRSDRAQNARSEALNLIRNRKGRCPHIAVVTAEPTPSRLSSLALGTGDLDCVYHFALDELISSVEKVCEDDTRHLLAMMISGKRMKDIADLPLDLAI